MEVQDLEAVGLVDSAVTAVSRHSDLRFLRRLGAGWIAEGKDHAVGYLLAVDDGSSILLGPGAAESPTVMMALMSLALHQLQRDHFLVRVLGSCTAFWQWLQQAGLRCRELNTLMVKGPYLPPNGVILLASGLPEGT
jgi:hypothetical protein